MNQAGSVATDAGGSDAADLLLRDVLAETLGLSAARVAAFTPGTGLFGH